MMNSKVKKMSNDKGITLIALVVTMIVLLILAGVTAKVIVGDDGVIQKAEKVENKYTHDVENKEKEVNELEEKLKEQTSRKVAIKIIAEDNPNEVLFDCMLGVYKDSQCQQLLKQIYVDESLPVSKGYSYESDNILENGTYYIKMISATEGYNINAEVFKFEVTNGRNVLTIKLGK